MFDRLPAGVSEIVEEHADFAAVLHKAIFQDDTAQHAASTVEAVLSKLAHGPTGRSVLVA